MKKPILPPQLSQKQLAKIEEAFRKKLDEKREANTEYQRRKMMTQYERGREAMEDLGGKIRDYNDRMQGKETSGEEAMKKAREVAHRAERRLKGE